MRRHIVSAIACCLLVAVSLAARGAAAKPAPATGSLALAGSSEYGSTLVVSADWDGVKRHEAVRVQVLCLQDIGVVYGEAYDGEAPGDYVFVLGQPDPLRGTSVWDGAPASCRVDLFTVTPNRDVTFLATAEV